MKKISIAFLLTILVGMSFAQNRTPLTSKGSDDLHLPEDFRNGDIPRFSEDFIDSLISDKDIVIFLFSKTIVLQDKKIDSLQHVVDSLSKGLGFYKEYYSYSCPLIENSALYKRGNRRWVARFINQKKAIVDFENFINFTKRHNQ